MFLVGCYSMFEQSQGLAMRGAVPRRVGVSISLYPPRGWKGGNYTKLAPSKELLNDYKNGNVGITEYCRIYREETLAHLDPHSVEEDLRQMGSEIVMLCYEPPGDFCHRTIVADWLSVALKRYVPELAKPDFILKPLASLRRSSPPMTISRKYVELEPDPEPPFSPGESTQWGKVLNSGPFHTTFMNDLGQKVIRHNELDLQLRD